MTECFGACLPDLPEMQKNLLFLDPQIDTSDRGKSGLLEESFSRDNLITAFWSRILKKLGDATEPEMGRKIS